MASAFLIFIHLVQHLRLLIVEQTLTSMLRIDLAPKEPNKTQTLNLQTLNSETPNAHDALPSAKAAACKVRLSGKRLAPEFTEAHLIRAAA